MSDRTDVIRLNVLGTDRELPFTEDEAVVSPHTGRVLRRTTATLIVAKESQADFDEYVRIHQAGGEPAIDADDCAWIIRVRSNSWQEGSGVVTYVLELHEAEVLEMTRLELLGMSLAPTDFNESVDDGDILLGVRVDLDAAHASALAEELTRFRGDDPYFDVRRVGINDEQRAMRFGRCVWQDLENGGRAFRFWLVSRSDSTDDDAGGMLLNEPEMSNIRGILAEYACLVDNLLEKLLRSHVLDDVEVEKMRSDSRSLIGARTLDFAKTKDVDLFR